MQHKSLINIPLSLVFTLLIGVFLIGGPEQADAQDSVESANAVGASVGTAFTYQGRLTDNGNPANGKYDFVFELYDAETDGAKVGDTQSLNDVDVLQGYFSVQLDFGNVFTGDARFLEIGVRLGDSRENYTKLSPRRRITPSPYTIHADHISGLSAPDGSPKNAVVVDNNGKLNVKNGLLIEGKKPVLIRRFLAYGNNVLDSCEMNIFQI